MSVAGCRGTEERVKVTLCSSLTVGDGDETFSGLSPTPEADDEALGARYQSSPPPFYKLE